MSINVNVTGNPVSINRGKMVALDPDYARKEFEKRRRIRLEQVRQQSKNIAEDVRNKVRKEKSKQLSDIERRGEKELKKWQARKLLTLQKQYQECLNDIGLGHMQAALEEESECALEVQKEAQNQAAKERGKQAARKLLDGYQKEQRDKAAHDQKKKFQQAIENTRSNMVANLNKYKKGQSPFKKKKRKKVSTDINISSRISSGSESEDEIPALLNLSADNSDSECSNTSNPTGNNVQQGSRPLPTAEETRAYTTTSQQSSVPQRIENEEDKLKSVHDFSPTKRNPYDTRSSGAGRNYPVDTRISDRIKSRMLSNSEYNHYDSVCDNHVPKNYESRHTIRSNPSETLPKKLSQQLTSKVNIMPIAEEKDQSKSEKRSNDKVSKVVEEEIPSKPTITLRTAQNSSQKHLKSIQSENSSSNLNKVQYYDHRNRYTREYVPDNINVEKIPEDSIQVCASSGSEAEFMEQMYKRDREAEIRGRKALQKEKVRRDYKEMMKQLPSLQKQERIASIPASKSKFHMSDERLKEHERKIQNRMDNAYEKLFPTSRIITIPQRNVTKPTESDSNNLPYKTISLDDNPAILNVASWDIDNKRRPEVVAPRDVQSVYMQEVAGKVPDESSDPTKAAVQRAESLQKMLRRLTEQREKLANELTQLPENSNLHKVFEDLEQIDEIIEAGKTMEKNGNGSLMSSGSRKRSRSKGKKSTQKENNKASSFSLSSSHPKQHADAIKEFDRDRSPEKHRKISKYHQNCTSESSSSPSPPTKISNSIKTKAEQHRLSRPPPLVLQNMSTQTTPTMELTKTRGSESKSQLSAPPSSPRSSKKSETVKNLHPCECKEQVQDESSDMCEIVIKITEDGRPKICVSPTKSKDKKIVVKTETKVDNLPLEESKTKDILVPPKTEKPRSRKPTHLEEPERAENVNEIGKSKGSVKPKQKLVSSWREFLSQNSTTSSTSYFSPPEMIAKHLSGLSYFDAGLNQVCPCGSRMHSHLHHVHPPHAQPPSKRHFSSILKDKPQQSNIQAESSVSNASSISQNAKQMNPLILQYIKKLLLMSRKNVDDLTVSSVSDVSTPTSSIINANMNYPAEELQNIMKHFNLNKTDIEQVLSSPDGSNIHYNTEKSLTVSSSGSSNIVNSTPINQSDVRQMTLDEYSAENYPNVLAVYNRLAESCAKKIENLAAMIEKVRLDKLNMLHSPGSGSDKENSTRYMDLPTEFKAQMHEERYKSPSPDSAAEQEELTRQLLQIDYSFAERLKKMTPAEIKEMFPLDDNNDNPNKSSKNYDQKRDSTDSELLRRFRNLRSSGINTADIGKTDEVETNETQDLDAPFVPLLIDIPRLPKLELSQASNNSGPYKNNEHSKPPTSKGLLVARRFNNNISLMPHELSTIAESESLVSTKLHQSRESLKSDKSMPETIPAVVAFPSPIDHRKITKDAKESAEVKEIEGNVDANLPTSSSDSLPDILTELVKNSTVQGKSLQKYKSDSSKQAVPLELVSDSSTSELENMESMLKSLGMGWAVATLRKTQEALALTSSSSSVDISLKQNEIKVTDSSSTTSEISIREVLGRQFLRKLSSSNGKSDEMDGSSSFMRELQDMSGIKSSGGSQEKTNQRTSTPIQASKTDDKSKDGSHLNIIVTGDSELSSVRTHSDDNYNKDQFYSLNESSKSRNNSKGE